MRRILLSLLVTAFIYIHSVEAGFSIYLDAQPGGSTDAVALLQVGQNIDVDVILELTGNTTLSAYQFSVQYDATALQFNLAASQEFIPPGFELQNNGFSAGPPQSGIGTISGIDAGTLGSGLAAPTQLLAARLNFTALAIFDDGIDGDDILPGFFTLGDAAFDSTMPLAQSLAPSFQGADTVITAVPEPSSIILVGLAGSVSALGLRIRRRRLRHETTSTRR